MKYDGILVLAGGLTDEMSLPEAVIQRVTVAYNLYRFGVARQVVFSGLWSNYWNPQPPNATEAALMRRYAIELGIPRSVAQLEEHSQNTYENIFYCFKLFVEPLQWKSILIVTSDFHVNRVEHIAAGILKSHSHFRVIGVPTRATLYQRVFRQIKESVSLHTQWFFQYMSDRS